MNPFKVRIRVEATKWWVTEIHPATKPTERVQTGTIRVAASNDTPKSWTWWAVHTGTVWNITGSGAVMPYSGRRLDATQFPFMSEGIFNMNLKRVLAKWLDDNRKPSGAAIKGNSVAAVTPGTQVSVAARKETERPTTPPPPRMPEHIEVKATTAIPLASAPVPLRPSVIASESAAVEKTPPVKEADNQTKPNRNLKEFFQQRFWPNRR